MRLVLVKNMYSGDGLTVLTAGPVPLPRERLLVGYLNTRPRAHADASSRSAHLCLQRKPLSLNLGLKTRVVNCWRWLPPCARETRTAIGRPPRLARGKRPPPPPRHH